MPTSIARRDLIKPILVFVIMLKNTMDSVEDKNTKIEIFGLGYVGFPENFYGIANFIRICCSNYQALSNKKFLKKVRYGII